MPNRKDISWLQHVPSWFIWFPHLIHHLKILTANIWNDHFESILKTAWPPWSLRDFLLISFGDPKPKRHGLCVAVWSHRSQALLGLKEDNALEDLPFALELSGTPSTRDTKLQLSGLVNVACWGFDHCANTQIQ